MQTHTHREGRYALASIHRTPWQSTAKPAPVRRWRLGLVLFLERLFARRTMSYV
jgi:hypothetical protein